jgi:capsular polysaccharide transport system permease protein
MRFARILNRAPDLGPAPPAAGHAVARATDAIPPTRVRRWRSPAAIGHRDLRFAGQASPRDIRVRLRTVSFAVAVVLPIAVAACYYFLIAADQYVAEFRFTLSTADLPRLDPLSLLVGNTVQSPAALQSQILVQYITSRAMVDRVNATLDLRRLFSPPAADWWSRLPLPVPIEELVRYWRGQVDPFYDPANGTVTVKVRAYTPEDALRLSEAIVAACEKLVNEISMRARRDALAGAEEELARAEIRLTSALEKIREFRDREGLIDPARSAESAGVLATRLRDELIRANAEVATLKSYMRDDAPPVKVLKARIKSLAHQRLLLAQELTATKGANSDPLSRTLGSYEQLESERKFAEAAYQLALRSVDQARASADRQHVFIASYIPPSLPEKALYPRRWRSVGTVALIALAVWGIGGLTAQSVRDHLFG